MKSVAEWLRVLSEGLPLPDPAPGDGPDYAFPEAHRLGGELPRGHLHVWGGPAVQTLDQSAGKTAVLLGLLHDAARRGRETLLATYDLSPATLALRLLAMTSGVPVADLESGRLRAPRPPDAAAAAAVARARARLEATPLRILEARGCGVAALEWHVLRDPRRVEVLGVDFLQAVVRPSAQSAAGALHDLAALAARCHMAVVVVSRGPLPAPGEAPGDDLAREADRVGWIGPAAAAPSLAEARLLANRHGVRHAFTLRYDAATSRWLAPDTPR
jgi:hypothetical protein